MHLLRGWRAHSELGEALDGAVRESLRPVAGALALLYAVLAPVHLALLPAGAREAMAATAALSALLCGGLWVRWRRRPPPARAAHPLLTLLAAVILANSALHMALRADIFQTTNFAILAIAAGFLYLSRAWFAAVLGATLATWAALALALPSTPLRTHFVFMLVIASTVAVVAHSSRRRATIRAESARLASERETVRVRAESLEALRASEERMRAILEAAPVHVFLRDAEGRFLLANRAVAEAYGSTPEAMTGRRPHELLPGGGEEEPGPEDDARALARGRVLRELGFHDAEGRRRVLEMAKLPFPPGAASPAVLGVGMDVTVRKRLEAEREQLEAQVKQSQKLESLGVLAGGIAHDFNNLLTGVMASAALALDELPESHPARPPVATALEASERAAQLTGQLLAYARQRPLTLRSVDASEEVRAAAELLRTAISGRVRLELELAEDLPPVEADPAQLQQVLMNLVINAAEACHEEPGRVTVRTGWIDLDDVQARELAVPDRLEPGRYAFLEVEDTGRGMEAAERERIFDPFYTTKFEGRGLGLASTIGIVRSHGGGLEVASRPGAGTRFRILLPAAAETPRATASPERAARTEGPSGACRVLVVDDERMVRELARRALAARGYEVETAASGREAVERLRHGGIDVAVLDLTMPEMSGLDVLEAAGEEVATVLSSGFDRETVVDSGAVFLPKPWRPADLADAVAKAVRRRQGAEAGGHAPG